MSVTEDTTDPVNDLSDEVDRRLAIAEGLTALGAWLIAHPEVPIPYQLKDYGSLNIYTSYDEDPKAMLATVARAMGHCEKFTTPSLFGVRRTFGPIRLDAQAPHEEVCERVVVGVEEVEEPDPDAVAALPKVKRQQEVIEWRCPPSLLNPHAYTPGEIQAGTAGVEQAKAALSPVPDEEPF